MAGHREESDRNMNLLPENFPSFQFLPPEIRQKIGQCAFDGPRRFTAGSDWVFGVSGYDLDLACNCPHPDRFRGSRSCDHLYSPFWPVTFHINRESRYESQRHFQVLWMETTYGIAYRVSDESDDTKLLAATWRERLRPRASSGGQSSSSKTQRPFCINLETDVIGINCRSLIMNNFNWLVSPERPNKECFHHIKKLEVYEYAEKSDWNWIETYRTDGDSAVLRQFPALTDICFVPYRHYGRSLPRPEDDYAENLKGFKLASEAIQYLTNIIRRGDSQRQFPNLTIHEDYKWCWSRPYERLEILPLPARISILHNGVDYPPREDW
jgi:hypothetical protein